MLLQRRENAAELTELGLDLSIKDRLSEGVPRASVDKEELRQEAMETAEQQAAIAAKSKGQDNPQKSSDNKASGKANMSSEQLFKILGKSRNARDFFGKMKNHLANAAGVATPITPPEVVEFLDLAEISEAKDIVRLAAIAVDLVNSSVKEAE